MIIQSLIRCLLLFGLMARVRSSPPTTTINLPLLEEKTVGTEVHDLMEEIPVDDREGITFKIIKQYLTLGGDEIDDKTNWVTLNKETGVLKVATPVDRERDCRADQSKQCIVHVKVVRQPQQMLHFFDINLNVIDINDHAPKFPIAPILVNMSESAPVNYRISLEKYLATDEDAGTNSKIHYTLTRSNYFSIHQFNNPDTGDPQLQLVVTNDLDREEISTYDLTLTATDRGTPGRQSSSVTLRVIVVDANDNSPVFSDKIYRVSMRENAQPVRDLITVHAEDSDDNMFGEVRYFIPTSGNPHMIQDLVKVNPISGEVSLKKPLDREKHNNLRIVIAARDLAPENQQRIGKTVLVIEVIDENDNPPTVKVDVIVEWNGSAAFLSESASSGTYIALINADDPDEGINSNVTIEISTVVLDESSSNQELTESSYFTLEKDGFVKTTAKMDREKIRGFIIQIHTCDSGEPQLCSSHNLTVLLLDENDNAPFFISSPKSIVLGEDTDLGTVVVQVKANDRDSVYPPSLMLSKNKKVVKSLNGKIRYSLRGGGKCFVIDEVSGKLRLIRRLDYESKKLWKMTVTAWDMGIERKSANLSVTVNVSDVNDNLPVFTSPVEFNQTVAATIQSSDVIMKINAVDADDGEFSRITYSLVSEDGSRDLPRLFILNKHNGKLRLNMSNPHLPAVVGSHFLQIKAQDAGDPPLHDVTLLHVQVFDVPLAVLPTFTKVTEEIEVEGKDLTMVLIVSVASSALLLAIILVVVFVTCKRNKKQYKYHCKSAALPRDKARQNDLSYDGSVFITGERSLISSSQLSFSSSNWNKRKDNASDIASYKNRPTSRLSQKKLGSLPRSVTTAPMDHDSGRGDSDHETASCEDKVSSLPLKSHENSRLHFVDSVRQDNNLNPNCSDLCRQYGHSDTCWMPPIDNRNAENEYNYRPQIHHHALPEPHNVTQYSARCPDTISDTQPLYFLAASDSQQCSINYRPDSLPRMIAMNPHDVDYHSTSPNLYYEYPHQLHNQYIPSHVCAEQASMGNPYYSASEMFHNGYEAFDPSEITPVMNHQAASPEDAEVPPQAHVARNKSITPNKFIQNSFRHTSRGLSPVEESPLIVSCPQTPSKTNHYEEVSMEETQQIIDNIDRLIDQ